MKSSKSQYVWYDSKKIKNINTSFQYPDIDTELGIISVFGFPTLCVSQELHLFWGKSFGFLV